MKPTEHQCPLWVKSRHVQCKRHVRFAPNSDRESRFWQRVMSALPSKADVCGANRHVCFGPITDIQECGSRQKKHPETPPRGIFVASRILEMIIQADARDVETGAVEVGVERCGRRAGVGRLGRFCQRLVGQIDIEIFGPE